MLFIQSTFADLLKDSNKGIYFAEDESDATRIEENKENTQIKIHINDQTEMEIVTQDVDEDNDEEKASEKVMSETEMGKNNSAIESNPDSMETEEPAKIDDTKSDEILDQGMSNDYFLDFYILTQ